MKRYIALFMVLTMMLGVTGCKKNSANSNAQGTEQITQQAADSELMSNESTQTTNVETQAVIIDTVNTDTTNGVVNNNSTSTSSAHNKQIQKTVSSTTKQQATKKQAGTNATTAPVNLGTIHLDENPFTTKAPTTKATTRATTKATTKQKRSYYVCNGCGYKVSDSGKIGWDKIIAHGKKEMLAGNMKCSGYHTSWE